jgi:AbrB family looped-hinge helix DNA binding protein
MKDEQVTKIDKFGRVLIPQKIRKAMGLEADTPLVVEVCNGELILRPSAEEPILVRKGSVLVVRAEALKGLSGLEKEIRTERLRRVAALSKLRE